ncbi:GNAT family N-acetyltransferase [Negativibacillus massiliensis]|uniref:GNAT family N-acetyltransferase n=1 Tax=Negativibacillus massiliensis TaxID=1871035 RepID=UPI003AF22F4A
MHPQDLDDIMKIWLNENLNAHHFIDPSFWKEHLDEVRTAISDSDITVLTEEERVVGFLGMNQNYVEGLFVDKVYQGKGYGLALIRSAQENHPFLQLSVYQKNTSAITFYQHCGFCILSEKTQSNQNFNEFLMEWRKTRRE